MEFTFQKDKSPTNQNTADETHSAGRSTALLWYLWLLVMTAGIPLVALGVQPDGGPHATGGTETEDEPWRIWENDPQTLGPRTFRMDEWTNEYTGKNNEDLFWKSAYFYDLKILRVMKTYNWLWTVIQAGQWDELRLLKVIHLSLYSISVALWLMLGEG